MFWWGQGRDGLQSFVGIVRRRAWEQWRGRQGGGSRLAVDGPQVALSDLLVATRLPQGPLPLLPQLELLPSAPCRAQPQ